MSTNKSALSPADMRGVRREALRLAASIAAGVTHTGGRVEAVSVVAVAEEFEKYLTGGADDHVEELS